MKIKLISSIRGKSDERVELIRSIARALKRDDHTVFYEHLTEFDQKDLDAFSETEHYQFHKQILKNIKAADIVIAECTHQSLSVGYLISYAIELGKPMIILYHESVPEPNLFPSLTKENDIYLVPYSGIDDVATLAKEYVEYAQEDTDVRFNLMISADMHNYLSQAAKQQQVSMSGIVRKLITESREKVTSSAVSS